MLAVDPGILAPPAARSPPCVAALVATVALVYLELPLRAGPFRAPLVYGRPDTWEGFWYVVLAEQFRGSLQRPVRRPRRQGRPTLVAPDRRPVRDPRARRSRSAFVVTAMRRPRYALLTGTAVLITCFFAASYVNADIDRYYLGPALMAWTWLAILGGLLVERGRRDTGGLARRRPHGAHPAVALRRSRSCSSAVAAGRHAGSLRSCDRQRSQRRPRGGRLDGDRGRSAPLLEPNADRRQLVELFDAALVRPEVEGRRPDIFIVDDRTRLDQGLGGLTDVIDANLGRRPVYVMRQDPGEVAELAGPVRDRPLTSPEDGLLMHVLARRRPHDDRGLPATASPRRPRVARLSYFFPAHNEEANLEGLVDEALETLPTLAETFEIIAVDDGSQRRDAGHRRRARGRAIPDVVRAVHHPTNLGYGAALRSGFAAARYDLVAFTDGDRQFKVADIGRLTARLAERRRARRRRRLPDQARRPARPDRSTRGRTGSPTGSSSGSRSRDVDCACKLFRREALEGVARRIGRRVLLGRAAHQAARRRPDGRRGRRAALPADRRLADRREAAGRLPRRARLLAPAPADVGRTGARALRARRRRSSATEAGEPAASCSRPSPRPGRRRAS